MYAFRRDEPRIKPIAPMQKVKLVIAAVIFFHTGLHAQDSQETIAGLRAAYMQETNDSAKMFLAGQLANGYWFSKVDSANYYNDLARELAVKQGLGKAEAELLSLKSAIVLEEGKLPEALQYGFEALELAEKVDYVHIVGLTLNRMVMYTWNWKTTAKHWTTTYSRQRSLKKEKNCFTTRDHRPYL